jgi:CRP-like cAMP-binding protein
MNLCRKTTARAPSDLARRTDLNRSAQLSRGAGLVARNASDVRTNPLAELKQAVILNAIRRCPWFTGLSELDLSTIASMSVPQPVAKGDYLFTQGAAVRGFFVVQQGAIKVHRTNSNGKERVLHVFRPHESFAEETLLSGTGYSANASAVESSLVLMVPKAEFISLLKRRPELALRMLWSLNGHLHLLVSLLDDLTLKDVKTRLANWLIRHCTDPNSQEPCRIQLPTTKRLLALELGTVSETLSRTLAKFRSQRLLTVDGPTLTLLCPVQLVRLLRSEFAEPHASYQAQ